MGWFQVRDVPAFLTLLLTLLPISAIAADSRGPQPRASDSPSPTAATAATLVTEAEDSMLVANCSQPDYACGECETSLQNDFNDILNEITGGRLAPNGRWSEASFEGTATVLPQYSLQSVLARVTALMRRTNGGPGMNRLNFPLMGDSGSLQETSPGNPRVAIKSANAELWVTFNTDPSKPGYGALEVMRWDGKAGKYHFQEISFQNAPHDGSVARHVDLSGNRCIRCHKSPMRPNWDTYRAWATIVPPRDDFLESDPPPDSTAINGFTDGRIHRPDAITNSYLRFLNQIAVARAAAAAGKKPVSRLASLEIPYEPDFIQITPKPGRNASDLAKIAAIRSQVQQRGFYRIPHYPRKRDLKNYSQKTASNAGPSHTAFDQLLGQQMCQAAQTIKDNPNWNRMKYVAAGILYCESSGDPAIIAEYIPADVDGQPNWVKRRALDFFQTRMPNQPLTADTVLAAVTANTVQNHSMRDEYKMRRHEQYLDSLLRSQGVTSSTARNSTARRLSRTSINGVGGDFTAIQDPGGVQGVAESNPDVVAAFRYLLEPMGVPVQTWSMTVAQAASDTSYAFSDQFMDSLKDQRQLREVYNEAGKDCAKLKVLSRAAIGTLDPSTEIVLSPQPAVVLTPTTDCAGERGFAPAEFVRAPFASISEIVQVQRTGEAVRLLGRCKTCHDFPLVPLTEVMNAAGPEGRVQRIEAIRRAQSWLNSSSTKLDESGKPQTWNERVTTALRAGLNQYHLKMPPGGWSGGNSAQDEEDRRFLATYIESLAQIDPEVVSARMCAKVRWDREKAVRLPATMPAATPDNSDNGE